MAQRKLYEAEAEVEARKWEKQRWDVAFQAINQEFEFQRFQLHQRKSMSRSGSDAAREECCDCESTNGSDLGITEQSKFLVRLKRILRS